VAEVWLLGKCHPLFILAFSLAVLLGSFSSHVHGPINSRVIKLGAVCDRMERFRFRVADADDAPLACYCQLLRSTPTGMQ
jgi:hypothetical protein